MYILGIESTCDETGVSIVQNGRNILSNFLLSQVSLHKEYGGVYPELASRCHFQSILPLINECIMQSGLCQKEIGAIAVAKGPGLIGSLLMGINTAKTLSI